MKKLSAQSVAELKMVARERGIDVSGLKKAQIVEALQTTENNVITAPETKGSSESSVTENSNGVLISPQPEHVKTVKKPEPRPQDDHFKVAIFAVRSLNWSGVGKLDSGYNFVSKEVAEKWLTLRSVREASPEEVAAHFGA